MNDDFERELARWRPAAPPPDLLRRLRAAEPLEPAGGLWSACVALVRGEGRLYWPRIAAGFAALAVVMAAGWLVLSGPSAETPARTGDRSATSSSRAPEQDRGGQQDTFLASDRGELPAGTSLALGHFVRAGLSYAVFDAEPDASSTSRMPLEAASGPMRLNCGYTSAVRELDGYPFGPFHFNARDQF